MKRFTTALHVQKLHQSGATVTLKGVTKNKQFRQWEKPLSELAQTYIKRLSQ